MKNPSQDALKKQKRNLGLLVLGALIFVCVVSYFVFDSDNHGTLQAPKRQIDLPADKVNMQEIWMSRMEVEEKIREQRMKHLEDVLLDAKQKDVQQEQEAADLKKEIYGLKQELRVVVEKPNDVAPVYSQVISSAPDIAPIVVLEEVVMDERPSEKVLNIDRAIPAGTSARALLVSSTDAFCGTNATSDPQPVKLRILDDGHLPNNVKAKLKGSILIGSAYGDLSSERVFVRLERMTQTKDNGDFIETDVTGFVTGEDGKNGVRGVVVDRSSKLIKSAAISGFFGGVGQFLQATVNAQNITDATSGMPNNLRWDLIKEGGMSGASHAMDRLSEYYIKRAEQLMPIVQVAAGRIVDITFTHGMQIGDLHTKDRVKKIRNSNSNGKRRE